MKKAKTDTKVKTKESHIIIFGSIFIILLSFFFYNFSYAVKLDPENIVVHTNLLYFDGKFSHANVREDTQTALFVINQSDEILFANIYEFDKYYKEVNFQIQIDPWKNQFIKTDGPGVVHLQNEYGNARSVVKFSRWGVFKRYYIPKNFILGS